MKFKFIENILCVWFGNMLSAKTLEETLDEAQQFEQEKDYAFNKFVDLTKVDSVNISYDEMFVIAINRQIFIETLTDKFKTAVLVSTPLTYGLVRMFEMLVESEKITVKPFKNLQDAADCLGVDAELLKPNDK